MSEQNQVNLEVIKTYLETNKESEDVKGFLSGYQTEKELSIDSVKKFLNENKEGQSFFDSTKNQHLETWRKNNLDVLIQEEMKKRGLVESETEKQIRELKEEIEKERKANLTANLKIKAKDIAKDKGIPSEFADYLLGGDEEETVKNVEKFIVVWNDALTEAVKVKMGNNPPPRQSGDGNDEYTVAEFRKLPYAKRNELKHQNPDLYNKLLNDMRRV